eukprot:CAMPEP_0194204072 /NCGR_PEP_ID=MMETSP0156-20130528/3694_1 /TAXON_ID=33649 /ORGANISM="Thalassionema nitzschioides, Strain L26-B" /LENGTH=476 /DNA_ID=CAMNT_0038929993 /DNA_START=70 /DNA_END=1500 /DNA_ORIENTATION=-
MESPKYDFLCNPVYQVDFLSDAKGKRLGVTKRNVTFRFGFSNADAIADGHKGTNCRGEEHEVVLTWSLASGKREVKFDGSQVHYSKGKRTEMKFECSFTIRGQHTVKLVAHAAPALKNIPEFRQFDFFLDGLSFFDFPKIYELGQSSPHSAVMPRVSDISFAAPPRNVGPVAAPLENDRWDAQSTEYYGDYNHAQSGYSEPQLDYSVESAPAAVPVPTLYLVSAPVENFNAPTFATPPAPVAVDEFAPVAPPPPTSTDLSNMIMSAYEQPPSNPAILAIENGPNTFTRPQEPSFEQSYHSQLSSLPSTPSAFIPAVTNTPPRDSPVSTLSTPSALNSNEKLSMNYLYEPESSPQSVRQLSELEQAMQNLVNFDDINEPAVVPMQLTMVQKEEKKKNSGKSKGLPPSKAAWLGNNAPLSEMQAHAAPRNAPSKEVMRTHAFDPAAQQAGMMVVYGSQTNQPPPVQNNFGYSTYGRAY